MSEEIHKEEVKRIARVERFGISKGYLERKRNGVRWGIYVEMIL